LLLAAAANVKTADSARVLGDVLDEFKLPASEATKTADILAAAATSSAGGLMAVFEAFTYVGTRARALGLGVKDIAAAIIDLSKAGIQGDRAGTGLAMMLQRLADESPKGQKALDDLGVVAWNAQGKFVGLPKIIDQLHTAQQRMGTGSQRFLKDVSAAFGARAANAVAAFALRGVEGYNTVYKRLSSGDVEKAAALMNRGAGAGFRQLNKEFTAAGIAVYDKFEKPFTSAVMWVGEKLPAAVSTAAHVLGPFGHFLGSSLGTAWDLFIAGAKLVAAVLGPVVHLIDEIRTPLGLIGTAALGAFLGFKVFSAIPLLLTNVVIAAKGAMLAVGDLAVGAVASGAAIAESGVVAEVGWAGILGPIGAAFVGIGLLVSMFHHSSAASKEATDAAKAYADALKSGNAAELTDTIVNQLTKNNVPAKVDELNKALGTGKYSAKQFASAIQSGGKPLTDLRKNLQSVIDVNEKLAMQRARSLGRGQTTTADPILTAAHARATAARALLSDLNAQSNALTKNQIKEIATYKSLGMVAVAVDEVGSKLGIGSDAVKKYAGMLGLAVTKNGDLVNATKANQQAILAVSKAYDTATQSGNDFLTAEESFSKSAGTSADRAAMIGATLKASNGDALSFAAAMAATTTSADALFDAFKSQRDQLKQQAADQKAAGETVTKAHRGVETSTARVTAAESGLSQVRANSKSTAAQIKAAEAAVTAAQNAAKNSADQLGQAQTAAGKAGALAYADTERAALKFTGAGAKTKVTIDTTAKGAGDLVAQLQAIQDSAMKAAGAMFQHQRSVEDGTKAADDAYNVYVTKTRGVFIDSQGNLTEQARQLGLTKDQAKALADQYLRTPATVKTLIEAEGANPVVAVLNKIGQLLANITGQQWNIPVNVMVHGSIPHPAAQTGRGGQAAGPGFASGGDIKGRGPRGVDSVPILGAPGEWMATTSGSDVLHRLFGNAGLKAINLGRMPTIPMSASPAGSRAAAAGGAALDAGGWHVHGDLNVNAKYPEPEPMSKLTPRALRMARIPLGG
jgi:TP901 family phage tail tape measure protein